jgi:hypothetical protein
MPEKLTLEWLREMVTREMKNMHQQESMLLESPYDADNGEFSELVNMLNGRGGESTIVIMTPENPLGKKASDDENDSRRASFEAEMQKLGQKVIPIIGKYGAEENSYILPGMSRDDAVKYGSDFDQDSVIYGERKQLDQGDAIEYQMIYTSKGSDADPEAGTRYVAVSGAEADARDDLFSKYNGEKFFIPFYESEYEGVYPWDLNKQPESEEAQEPEVSVEP